MQMPANSPAPTPEHLAQLDAARVAGGKIRRAVAVANFDGWTIAGVAAITIVCSLTSISGIALGLGMTYVAWRELSSAAALKKLDPEAPRRLAINQLVLCGMLVLYFGWTLFQDLTGPSASSQLIAEAPDAQSMLGNFSGIDDISREFDIILYVGLILTSVLAQGLTARYYSSRGRILKEYQTTTPQWILDYQQGGGTL
jgi:hypothetical protein